MKITGFGLKKSDFEGAAVAYGKIVIENLFEVDISLMTGKNGLFVSYPSKKGKDGRYYPQFKVLDKMVADSFQEQVIKFYEQNIKQG
jgi:DNA-binding cell septation regulator SpoVG